MQTVEKQANPVILNDKGNPIALIFFTQDRNRIIYTLQKADESELIELLTHSPTPRTP